MELVSYTPQKTGSNQAVAGLMMVDGDVSATATELLFVIVGDTYGNSRKEASKDKAGTTLKQPEATGGKTILRMVREGSKIKTSVSKDGGETFGGVSSTEFVSELPETIKIGVACNSGDNSKQSTAVFANFKINNTVTDF